MNNMRAAFHSITPDGLTAGVVFAHRRRYASLPGRERFCNRERT